MSAVEAIGLSGSELQDQFLTLFIEQMKQQDPLNPMSNEQTLSQLAQFTQVEQMTALNKTFGEVLQTTRLSDASAMLGRRVSFYDEENVTLVTMTPERVEIDDGEVLLVAGDRRVGLSDIVAVEGI